ncbi:MAG: class I adenylate-forming enzyme family protein [Ignavibacteriaceae bacterium]
MFSINAFLLKTQELSSPAIYSNSDQLNYEEFRNKVLKTAGILSAMGLGDKDNIAIIGNSDVDFIINLLALWQIKAVPVLISPRLTNNEIEEQIITADCKVVLQNRIIKSIDPSFDIKVFSYPFGEELEPEDIEPGKELNPEDNAVIIFTSGASGNSKGVELSFNNLLQSARIGDKIIHHNEEDRWLASLPFYHIGGFSIISRSLLFGTSIIIPESLQIQDLAEVMKNFNPTLCSFVPTQLKRMLAADILPNDELRHTLLGGGFIDQRLVFDAISDGWNITKVYGSTETSSFVSSISDQEIYDKPRSVGAAIKPNQIMIVNENRFQIPWGEIGEIAVSSPAVMKGYYNDEDETEKKIEDGFYFTGDIGFVDVDGCLFIESRRTDLIITGGENVNPYEVEKRLNEHPEILDAAVFPLKDDDWGEIVAAAIVLKNNKSNIGIDGIQEFVKDDLAGFKIPKKLFFESELPRNELGKILRSKLIEKYQEG